MTGGEGDNQPFMIIQGDLFQTFSDICNRFISKIQHFVYDSLNCLPSFIGGVVRQVATKLTHVLCGFKTLNEYCNYDTIDYINFNFSSI